MNATEAVRKMRQVIRRPHKALATEANYVHWLRHYLAALLEIPPALASEQKLEWFLTELALKRDVAARTHNQAFNAIAFFYRDVLGKPLHDVDALRATPPVHLRHAPTISEIRALLQAVSDLAAYPANLIARLLYGCGLRVTEPLNLRIKDLNLEGAVLFILGAKGGKDRVVSLPRSLTPELASRQNGPRVYQEPPAQVILGSARPLSAGFDLENKIPGILQKSAGQPAHCGSPGHASLARISLIAPASDNISATATY